MKFFFRNIHIIVSLLSYTAALALPGFYQGDNWEAQFGLYLLGTGWAGLLAGQLSWFANLGLLIALITGRLRLISAAVASGSLYMALGFLKTVSLPAGSSGNMIPIDGYGWGYYFWISALAIMAFGQLATALKAWPWLLGLLTSGWVIITGPMFYQYHKPLGELIDNYNQQREAAFIQMCNDAKFTVLKKVDGKGSGIYFDVDYGESATVADGRAQAFGGGTQAKAFLSHNVPFVEIRQDGSNYYQRVFLDHSKDTTITTIASKYGYYRTGHIFPENFHFRSATGTIKDLSDDSIIATSTYIYDEKRFRFCGPVSDGGFTIWDVISKGLNLER